MSRISSHWNVDVGIRREMNSAYWRIYGMFMVVDQGGQLL